MQQLMTTSNDSCLQQPSSHLMKPIADTKTEISVLQTVINDYHWMSTSHKDEGVEAVTAMHDALDLGLLNQVKHYHGFVHQALWKDFLADEQNRHGNDIRIVAVNNADIDAGQHVKEVSSWGSPTKVEQYLPHEIDGDVPIPAVGFKLFKDLVKHPVAPHLVQNMKIIEIYEQAVDPDPWLLIMVGGQWFKVLEWILPNRYGDIG